MAFSRLLCTKSTKNMFVKIVHPGGHAELHDRPILAADVMLRNPKCVVAHPHVFQQPWAIVAPDTRLMLGQKFYVVPISTVRKLQRKSLKHRPSPVHDVQADETPTANEKDDTSTACWFFMIKNMKAPYCCLHNPNKDDERTNTEGFRNIITDDSKRDLCSSNENCFMCLLSGIKTNKGNGGDDKSEEVNSSSSNVSSSETKGLTCSKRNKDLPTSLDQWHSNLESIVEEKSN